MISYKEFLRELKVMADFACAEFDVKAKETKKKIKDLENDRINLEDELETLEKSISTLKDKGQGILAKAGADADRILGNATHVCEQQYSQLEANQKVLDKAKATFDTERAKLDEEQRMTKSQKLSVTEMWEEARDLAISNATELTELKLLKEDIANLHSKTEKERIANEKALNEAVSVRDQAQQATSELIKQRNILENQVAQYRTDMAKFNKDKSIFADKSRLSSLTSEEIQVKIDELRVEGEKVKKLKKDLDDKERALKAMKK